MIIYKATNLITGKSYIGKTINFAKRRKAHIDNALKGSKTMFHQSILKHGQENFKWEILEEGVDEIELNDREMYYINELDTFKTGYNMTHGGDGGATIFKGTELYERVKHKFSNWKNGNPGATPEAIAKRVESFKSVIWPKGPEHANYGKPRYDIRGKPSHNAKPVIIDGVRYESTGKASIALNLKDSEVVRLRCNSKIKWPNYKYE